MINSARVTLYLILTGAGGTGIIWLLSAFHWFGSLPKPIAATVVIGLMLLVALLFLAFILVVLISFGAISKIIFRRLRVLLFLRHHDGRNFFVAQDRRGWREFQDNNLIPILDPSVGVIWPDGNDYKPLLWILREFSRDTVARPLLLTVAGFSLHITSLHGILSSIAAQRARSLETQRAIREALKPIDTVTKIFRNSI